MIEIKLERLEAILTSLIGSLDPDLSVAGGPGIVDWDNVTRRFTGFATAAVIVADNIYSNITGKTGIAKLDIAFYNKYEPHFAGNAKTNLGVAVAVACEGMLVGLTLGEDYGGPFNPDINDRKNFISSMLETVSIGRDHGTPVKPDDAKVLAALLQAGWVNPDYFHDDRTMEAISLAAGYSVRELDNPLTPGAVTPNDPENLQERWARLAGILIKESR